MKRIRSQKGQIAEFGPALVVFVCFILAPLVNISIIPVRYFVANGIVNEYTHTLSLAESRKRAYAMTSEKGSDNWWRNFLTSCGMTVHQPKLALVVCDSNTGENVVFQQNQSVPANYLPGGSKQCIYNLELAVAIDVPPLFNGGSAGLPGLTGPLTMNFKSRSNWENMGRNPVSREFYINEI